MRRCLDGCKSMTLLAKRVAAMGCLLILSLMILASSPAQAANAPGNGPSWRIFKNFRYDRMPSLDNCGLASLRIYYPGDLFGTAPRGRPNLDQLRNVVAPDIVKNGYKTVVLDIEHWNPLTEMDKYVTVIRTLRAAVRAAGATDVKFGYYLILPYRNYETAVHGSPAALKAWSDRNAKLAPLAREVDLIFPSLYTFLDNQKAWVKYARANVQEARKYNKPVYAYVWPQIHNSNPTIGLQHLSASFWQLQLDTLRGITDGVVIWGSLAPDNGAPGNKRVAWDATMPWWQVTKSYAQTYSAVPFGNCVDR